MTARTTYPDARRIGADHDVAFDYVFSGIHRRRHFTAVVDDDHVESDDYTLQDWPYTQWILFQSEE
jgi:hypothetical protein